MDTNTVLQWLVMLATAGAALAAYLQARQARIDGAVTEALARDANNLAAASNEIARQANDTADVMAARSSERNDVRWTVTLDEPSWLVTVRNEGIDTAAEVEVILEVAGQSFVVSASDVRSEPLEIDASEPIKPILEAHRRHVIEMNSSPHVIWASMGATITASGRILWRTPLGAWHEQVVDREWKGFE